jgi:hypothetical protein
MRSSFGTQPLEFLLSTSHTQPRYILLLNLEMPDFALVLGLFPHHLGPFAFGVFEFGDRGGLELACAYSIGEQDIKLSVGSSGGQRTRWHDVEVHTLRILEA